MANTFQLISSNILGSSTSAITFSSIPGTYTDLLLKASARGDNTGTSFGSFILTVNGSSSSIYSFTRLLGNANNGSSGGFSTQTSITANYYSATTATTSAFGNAEFYFGSYASSLKKPFYYHGVQEDNNSTAYMASTAGRIDLTSAITSITLTANAGWSFISGSSFYLYGIKNS